MRINFLSLVDTSTRDEVIPFQTVRADMRLYQKNY